MVLACSTTDWEPLSEGVLRDQRAAYDDMRERCPVARSEALGWSVFRHADVRRILFDPDTFSNVVSSRRSVPNGMDPPEHTRFRRLIDPCFASTRVQAFEPRCRAIADHLAGALPDGGRFEFMEAFAQPFAVRAQCAFVGWPADMHAPLAAWVERNQAAVREQDREALAANARVFEGHVETLLRTRREGGATNGVIDGLLRERVDGRRLREEEIVSILRNWTVGEVGTIAAALGIVARFLSDNAPLQTLLRSDPTPLPAVIEEALRMHGPLVTNRRITTRAVRIGGRWIDAGEPISLNWVAANRDGRAFGEPNTFRLDRDPASNLLYGAGIHACPGAGLARMELRVAIEELLRHTAGLAPADVPAQPARYPASGFGTLPLRLR